MQMRALLATLLLSVASASQLVRNAESPVTKVVELVSMLKAKVEADGASEQASYDKFACWCEDTLGEKATEISDAKETIEKTQTLVVKLKSEIASHQVEIKQLEKDIAANIESTREATEMREKESESYEGEKIESEQCIGALEAAIKVLTGAGENRKSFLGTLQEAQLLGVTAGLKNILRRASVEKSLKEQDLEVVRRFVEKPEDFVAGSKATEIAAVQIANNPFGDYAPQSTQIQGILKSMYDSFTGDLEKANVEEAKKQKSFEELMETKTAEKKTLEGSLETHTSSEADKTKELADSKTLLDDTKEQLESDEKFFASTKDTCKTKAGDWATRSRIRTEEIQAMNQAIEILTSDEAKATFKESAETFVQLRSVRKSMGPKRNAAYLQLRNLATKYQSLSLAKLATAVTTTGHFDKVMNDIDKMIAILRQEEQDDIKQRDICERQQNKNKNQMEDLNYDIKKSEAMLERLGDDAKALEDQKKALEDDMTNAKKEMETMKENREDEYNEFTKAMKHDMIAVQLLEQAIAKLSNFYNGADKKASLVQKKADPMPETSFQGNDYKGRQGEGQGIIAILTLVKDDIVAEIKTTTKDDGEAQVNFENDLNALINSWRDMEKSKLSVEKRLAQLELKINDVEEFKGSKEGDLSGEEDLEASIGTNCKWVETHFESRATKRKNEIDGLIDAKNFLAGME